MGTQLQFVFDPEKLKLMKSVSAIGDHQSVYDPKDPNDRLLLGMKGTMSEAELNLIKFRMRQGRLSKARRGALYTTLPPGYVLGAEGEVEKSADRREREARNMSMKMRHRFQ